MGAPYPSRNEIGLGHGLVGTDELAVLLEAVEYEGAPYETLLNQLPHVHHRRGVAECQAHLSLKPLGLRKSVGLPGVLVVVGYGFLAEAVLPGLKRGKDKSLMVIGVLGDRPGADVHDIQVFIAQHLDVIRVYTVDAELLCSSLRQLTVQVAYCHYLAQRRSRESR